MERLTEHSKKDFDNIIYSGNDEIAIVKKLAKYEDTGLAPEQIEQLKSDKDFWEREAKKWCSKLGEIRLYAEIHRRDTLQGRQRDKGVIY